MASARTGALFDAPHALPVRAAEHWYALALELHLPDRPLPIQGDRTRLIQILGNLLENAEKFTRRGGRVSVHAMVLGDRLRLSIRDTGAGMTDETRTTLFQPFVELKRSVERGQGGLGLGLSLVKRLVEMHDGTVRATSAGPGLGSEFTLELPLARAQAFSEHPCTPEPLPLRAHRILIIEDNVDAAQTLQRMLEMAGHEVTVANSGEEGAARANEFRPSLVLSDIGLPGRMNGYDVARAFRRDPSLYCVPLIAVTGFDQKEDRARALGAGFDEYLVKPFDYDAVVRALSRLPEVVPERLERSNT